MTYTVLAECILAYERKHIIGLGLAESLLLHTLSVLADTIQGYTAYG